MARDRSRSPPCDWTADGWPSHDEYMQRKADLLRDGLHVKLEFDNDNGFMSFTVLILRGPMLRDEPPHRLHVSLCYDNEVDAALLRQICEKWHNVVTHLNIGWVGRGGTAYIEDCPFSACPLVSQAHSEGYYSGYGGLHISF